MPSKYNLAQKDASIERAKRMIGVAVANKRQHDAQHIKKICGLTLEEAYETIHTAEDGTKTRLMSRPVHKENPILTEIKNAVLKLQKAGSIPKGKLDKRVRNLIRKRAAV